MRRRSALRQAFVAGTALAVAGSAGAQLPPTSVVLPPSGQPGLTQKYLEVLSNIKATRQIQTLDPSLNPVIDLSSGGKSASAVVIPDARLKRTSNEITSRITSETASGRSVLKELRSKYQSASRAIVRVNSTAAAAIGGGGYFTFPAIVGEMQVNEAFAAAIERARASGFETSPAQLQLLPATDILAEAATSAAALKPVSDAYAETIDEIEAVLASPADEAAKTKLRDSAKMTFDTFAEQWPELKKDWHARRVAVRALDALSRQSELKAIYGVRTEFAPKSYQSIFDQSERAVPVHHQDGRTVCSGFLVTAEWVMTAGHCFTGRSPLKMSATVGIEGAPALRLFFKDAWPEAPRGSKPSDPIDYAFVRIEPTGDILNAFKALEARTEKTAGRPLCIRETSGAFEEPVIVIAQSSQNRLVYDHAYVWYPYRPDSEEFDRVASMTGIRLHRFAEAAWPESRQEQEKFFKENIDTFEAAYRSFQQGREYVWMPAEATTKRPMFGFDTDTVQGNSGGTVFGRGDACILGVFNGGQPDGVTISEATWREHEFATPIMAVIEDLEEFARAIPAQGATEKDLKRMQLVTALRAAKTP